MGYKSGGLSYFKDGGETDVEDTTVQSKPLAVRGGYSLPTPAGTVPVGAGVLDAMENLYREKQAEQQSFMEAMKDAQAWWTPGGANRAQALAERGKARELQSQSLFQIQAQLAQQKAALEAQREFERARSSGKLYGNLSAPDGAQTVASQLFGMPVEIRQAIQNAKTQAEADKIYNTWAQKKSEAEASPAFDTTTRPVVYWDEDRKEWVRGEASAREIRANPNKYFDPSYVEGRRAPAQAAPAQTEPAAPAPAAPATSELTPADRAIPPAPTAAAPAVTTPKAPTNFTFDELTQQQKDILAAKGEQLGLGRDVVSRPDAAELFNKQPLERRQQVFASLGPDESAQPPREKAPAAPAARPPKPTASELEREAEIQKQVKVQAESERLKTDKIERDKFVAESEPTRVSERKVRAERVAEMVLKNPTIVGVLTQGNVKSAIANVIQQGLSTPSGAISVKGLSEAIYQTLPSTMSMAERREIAGYIAQMELDASQAMNGQGQISDGEREIIRAASISIEDPAEVVYKKAKMMQLRQDTLQKLRNIYKTGDKYTTNFERFKNEPEYKKIAAEYENQLRSIAKEDVKFDRSQVGKEKTPTTGKTKSGVSWKVIP